MWYLVLNRKQEKHYYKKCPFLTYKVLVRVQDTKQCLKTIKKTFNYAEQTHGSHPYYNVLFNFLVSITNKQLKSAYKGPAYKELPVIRN